MLDSNNVSRLELFYFPVHVRAFILLNEETAKFVHLRWGICVCLQVCVLYRNQAHIKALGLCTCPVTLLSSGGAHCELSVNGMMDATPHSVGDERWSSTTPNGLNPLLPGDQRRGTNFCDLFELFEHLALASKLFICTMCLC